MTKPKTKIKVHEGDAALAVNYISDEDPVLLAADSRLATEAQTDEARLVERIISGDQQAEEELNWRYRQGMLIVLANKTSNAAVAEDLWHDTLIAVLRAIKNNKLKEPDKLRAFILGVGKNLVRDYFKMRRGEPILDDNFIYPGESALESLIRDENSEIIRQTVRKLKPAKYRELLQRFYLEEQDKEAICADIGMTESQFTVTLCRARQKLGKLLVKALHRKQTPKIGFGVRQTSGEGSRNQKK